MKLLLPGGGRKEPPLMDRPETCPGCRPRRSSPIGMRLVLLAGMLFATFTTGLANFDHQLWVRKLHAPAVVDPREDTIVMRCEYDLQDKELYSVNWYKNQQMLYRYMPSMNPRGMSYPDQSDVNVSLERSNGTHLVLRGHRDVKKNMHAYEGTYVCEVSTERSFLTGYAMANMSVAIRPKHDPILEGIAPYYQIGDHLEAICTSDPSYPAAELTFYLNNKRVDRVQSNLRIQPIDGTTSSTSLTLKLNLSRHHFSNGNLNVTCRVTLPGVELERDYRTSKSAALASSNQRYAQEPYKRSAGSTPGLTSTVAFTAAAATLIFGLI